MKKQQLHLIDEDGNQVPPAIQNAVEAAYRWATSEFPSIDAALVSNWAELLAKDMARKKDSLGSARRYAHAVMRRTSRKWLKGRGTKELFIGLSRELEGLARPYETFSGKIDLLILLQQLKSKLNERDHEILLLLQSGASPAEVGMSLGIKYEAAKKAIERLRQRVAACLEAAKYEEKPNTAGAKDLTKKWIS